MKTVEDLATSCPACASRQHGREGGMALVLVLGVLAATLLMVVHLMVVSEVIAKEAKVAVLRSELRYQAESAADVGFWMHLTDRRLFTNRKLGESAEVRLSMTDFEPWMLDRRPHALFEDRCQVYLMTVDRGFRVDKPEKLKDTVEPEDTERLDAINRFLDVLGDYVDKDDFRKLYGLERDDYAAMGLPMLPRNNAMQFREEVYWLENWTEMVADGITIIPPRGKSLPATDSKPSFFSTSDKYLQSLLFLTDSELSEVQRAREQWTEHGVPLNESLSPDLFLEIQANFNFIEPNVALITTSATDASGEVRLVHHVVREVDLGRSSIYSDRAKEAFSIWERKTE
ncbi:MAG TPA: hypothetical protein PLT23_01780 [Lentisphaeria bacterium]|nr:hypothetical protein [Lentisphaeria bacterium]HQL86161.1 hypothetical protein [Lentisphaeria bacterium]